MPTTTAVTSATPTISATVTATVETATVAAAVAVMTMMAAIARAGICATSQPDSAVSTTVAAA